MLQLVYFYIHFINFIRVKTNIFFFTLRNCAIKNSKKKTNKNQSKKKKRQHKQNKKYILFLKKAIGIRLSFLYWNTYSIVFYILIAMFEGFQNAASTILDSITLDILPDETKYGYYRLFAGLGWGVVSPIAGYLIDCCITLESLAYYFYMPFEFSLILLWFVAILFHLTCGKHNNYQKILSKHNHHHALSFNDDKLIIHDTIDGTNFYFFFPFFF